MLQQQQTTAAPVVPAAPAQPVDPNIPTEANRKQREVYVGNLAIGSVTPDILRELFNAVLAPMSPDPITYPAVVNVKMDNSCKMLHGFHGCMSFLHFN